MADNRFVVTGRSGDPSLPTRQLWRASRSLLWARHRRENTVLGAVLGINGIDQHPRGSESRSAAGPLCVKVALYTVWPNTVHMIQIPHDNTRHDDTWPPDCTNSGQGHYGIA